MAGYCSTPHSVTGVSPAKLLHGREMRNNPIIDGRSSLSRGAGPGFRKQRSFKTVCWHEARSQTIGYPARGPGVSETRSSSDAEQTRRTIFTWTSSCCVETVVMWLWNHRRVSNMNAIQLIWKGITRKHCLREIPLRWWENLHPQFLNARQPRDLLYRLIGSAPKWLADYDVGWLLKPVGLQWYE